jgi:phosphoglycolate phosphatase
MQMLDHARLSAASAYVATLKPKVYADRIVRRLGLEPYFSGIYGPELQESRFDDKAALLEHLLTVEKISPGHAVMIGDRAGDIVGARANGVRSIGVLWGYGSPAELTDAGADQLCESPPELVASLDRLAS